MAFSPAGLNTTNVGIQHYPAAYYKRRGLDQLMKMLVFNSVMTPDNLPSRNGKTIQWYRVDLPTANTTPSAEGVVGTSLAYSTLPISATVQQYSDFITISTLMLETDIAPTIENAVRWLGYRAGLTVDTLERTELQSSLSSYDLATIGPYLAMVDFLQAKTDLKANDVRGFDGGEKSEYRAIAHPYVLYDLMSDNTAGGFIDVMKYADPDDILNGEVGKAGGCRIMESTNVGTQGTAPTVQYFVYVVGEGCCGAVDLEGSGPSKIRDPRRQAFKTKVIREQGSMVDPEGNIGAAVSYRFVFVVKLLDEVTFRLRIILADASLV